MMVFHNQRRVFSIAVALALMIAAGAMVWWLSTGNLVAQGTADDSDDAEILAAALAVSTHSSALVSANSASTNISMDRETLRQSAVAVADHKRALAQQIEALKGNGYDERVGRIENLVNRLISNTEQIVRDRTPLLLALAQSARDQRKVLTD